MEVLVREINLGYQSYPNLSLEVTRVKKVEWPLQQNIVKSSIKPKKGMKHLMN